MCMRAVVRAMLILTIALPAVRAQIVPATRGAGLDVKSFGAVADGKTLDTEAINRTIEAAAGAAPGGATVRFPAGTYLSFSIHLKSNLTLVLERGATIVAAS